MPTKQELEIEVDKLHTIIEEKEDELEAYANTVEELKAQLKKSMTSASVESASISPTTLGTENLLVAILFASCLGALKDAQTLGPMEDKDFQASLPKFINQAATLCFNAIRTVPKIVENLNPSTEEAATEVTEAI